MTTVQHATIFFYDENSGEFKTCNVQRAKVQPLIERAMSMPVPLEEPGGSITDEDARRLGSMMLLMQGHANPELRERFKLAIERPIDWEPPQQPV